MLPKRAKGTKPWFQRDVLNLRKVLERTHVAFTNHVAKQDAASVATLRQCRSEQREAIKTAKSEWILEQCGVVGELTEFCELDQQFRSSKGAWKAAKTLELGLDTTVVAGSGAARLA